MDAGHIGRACVTLGAGRAKATDQIDFAVGCDHIRKVGERIESGAPFLRIHARDEASLATALPGFTSACTVE
jgi:thymidine phosphorylase